MFNLKKKTRSKDRVIGVDISSTSVKLIQIGYKNGNYHVEAYAQLTVSESDLSPNTVDDSEYIASLLERAFNIANPSTIQVVMAVPASLTISRVITIAADYDDDELEELIRMEAQQYIPYPLEEVSLDFERLSNKDSSVDSTNILLVATLTEHVNKCCEVAELAGLKPKVIEVESHSLERCYSLISDILPSSTHLVAILDVGHSKSILIILDRGRAIYSRDQVIAGMQLTLDIQNYFQMDAAEAELAKQQDTLPDDYKEKVLTPFITSIAEQTSRSLQLFFSSSEYSNIDHVLLAGGSAKISDFAKILQRQLGYPVTSVNPFTHMSCSSQVDRQQLEADASSLLVACGLAMRGVTP